MGTKWSVIGLPIGSEKHAPWTVICYTEWCVIAVAYAIANVARYEKIQISQCVE